MEPPKIDSELLNSFKGSSFSRNLTDLNVQLSLVQAAAAMAVEGVSRATASEIANRAIDKYGIEVTPSFTGQVFASFRLNTTTTHGKTRLVLDYQQLEAIRKDIVAKCEERTARLEEVMQEFDALPNRIKELQDRWKEIQGMKNRERLLLNALKEEQTNISRIEQLETEYARVKEKAEFAQNLQKECQALNRLVKKIPSLEEQQKALEAVVAKHEASVKAREKQLESRKQAIASRERDIAIRESQLADRINKLQKQAGWVELVELKQAVENAKKELKELSKQLGEKRSLLDKMLGRNKGGAA